MVVRSRTVTSSTAAGRFIRRFLFYYRCMYRYYLHLFCHQAMHRSCSSPTWIEYPLLLPVIPQYSVRVEHTHLCLLLRWFTINRTSRPRTLSIIPHPISRTLCHIAARSVRRSTSSSMTTTVVDICWAPGTPHEWQHLYGPRRNSGKK